MKYKSVSKDANKEGDYTWWDMLTFSVDWKLSPLHAAAKPISSKNYKYLNLNKQNKEQLLRNISEITIIVLEIQ